MTSATEPPSKPPGAENGVWTLRFYDALRLHPMLSGLLLILAWIAGFLAIEIATGGFIVEEATSTRINGDVWIAIILVSSFIYLSAAFATHARRRTITLRQLRENGTIPAATIENVAAKMGRYHRFGFAAFTALGVGVALAVPYTEAAFVPFSPYDISTWSFEVSIHRASSAFIGFGLARLAYAITADLVQLWRLAASIPRLDLTDPVRLAPFTTQGLTNSVLIVGFTSIYSVFLVDIRYVVIVTIIFVYTIIAASIGLLLPLWGVRARIRQEKERETAWCRARLTAARGQIGSAGSAGEMADVIAYLRLVQDAPDWPISGGAILRFGFYLLIPVLSWSGGAFVERAIDALLD